MSEHSNDSKHICEVCGKAATVGVRDITVDKSAGLAWAERKPLGPAHFFCDDHKRDGLEIDISTSGLYELPPNNEDDTP